ncbi:MAG TPA: ABC transporter ATP-binding protein, partial [Actinomycetota bacterium]|nr:ABC transporter ATP-binding protein [Actinomycetota bacterium]
TVEPPLIKESRRARAKRLRRNITRGLHLAWMSSPRSVVIILAMNAVAALMPPAAVWLGKELARVIRVGFATQQPFAFALPVVAALGAVAAAQRVIGILQATRQELFQRRVVLEVEYRFLQQAASVDLGHFDNSDWHDRVARAKRDMNWKPAQLTQSIIGLLGAVITTAGMLGLLLTLHPLLVVMSLLSVIPSLTIQRRVTRKIYKFFFTNTPEERERDYIADLVSQPKTSKEIRAFNLSDYLLKRRKDLAEDLFAEHSRLYRSANRAYGWSGILSGIALGVAYAFVASRGLAGQLRPEDLIVVIGAFASVTGQIGLISGSLIAIDQHATFLDDYFSFMEIETLVPSPAPSPSPITLARSQIELHGIEFSGVQFTYPGGTQPALDGLDLHIHCGEMLALVGENGAGKTSLVKLLLRFYDPQQGSIKIGGVDLRDLRPDVLRDRIGILFQDYAMYELSIRENVILGRADTQDHDDVLVMEALRRARSEWLVDQMPKGLDSKVGRLFEGGHDLSGGEWQRLALGRLMYRDADIWILDEPTASLDPEAEAGIFAELRENLRGRMGIVISHRFSTVRIADRIAVIADGGVTELGTHEELMAAGGRYSELFELQASGYR